MIAKNKNILVFSLAAVILLFTFGCASTTRGLCPTSEIRVALLKDINNVLIGTRWRYRIESIETDEVLREGWRLEPLTVSGSEKGIQAGDDIYYAKKIRLVSDWGITVFIEGQKKRFRGVLDIFLNDSGNLDVINVLDIESYIKGVLPREMAHRWPMEAMKAQAVAARTYAFYRVIDNVDLPYDATNDIYSQVYGGRGAERYRTNSAVNSTRGQVLSFEGEIIPAFYHSTCAGTTEDVRELWDFKAYPSLSGRKCDFCYTSPHYNWKKNFRLKDIQDKLNEKGYELDLIQEIKVLERNESSRVRSLAILTRTGKEVIISAKDFRGILGPNILKSNRYRIEMKGYYVDFVGRGWGHGVGLCQWGANEMARQRYSYWDILRYYYPGAEIADSGNVKSFISK